MSMGAWTITDGVRTESFFPVFEGYDQNAVKIEDQMRGKSGKLYTYNWTSYEKWTFGMTYVTSSQKHAFNDWWSRSTHLSLSPGYTTDVFTVQITGKKKPISGLIKPYTDQFRGKVVIEETS